MIDLQQLHRYVVRPVLARMQAVVPGVVHFDGLAAERFLIGLGLQESGLTFIDQAEKGGDKAPGPAFGLWQMEKPTHDDLWTSFLNYRPVFAGILQREAIGTPSAEQMTGNLYYACAACRMQLHRLPFTLPEADDYKAMAAAWKTYYNSASGAGNAAGAEKWFKLAVDQIVA